jgi:hypothetical protein
MMILPLNIQSLRQMLLVFGVVFLQPDRTFFECEKDKKTLEKSWKDRFKELNGLFIIVLNGQLIFCLTSLCVYAIMRLCDNAIT